LIQKWGVPVDDECRNRDLVFYVNGRWVKDVDAKISVLDSGLLHGWGIFEGIRIYPPGIFKLEEHLDRLYRSAKYLKLEIPVTKSELKGICTEFVRRNSLKLGHIRVLVSLGEGYSWWIYSPPTLLVLGVPVGHVSETLYREGLVVKTSSLRKNPIVCIDPRVKSLNYLNHKLHRLDAEAAGADEPLVLDTQGFVAELSGSNFFVASKGGLYTPRRHSVLEGVTRATVLELAEKNGIPTCETDLTLYDVYTADEAIASGTLSEVMPIVKIDGRVIGDGKPGPITRRLRELFEKLVTTDGPWFTKVD